MKVLLSLAVLALASCTGQYGSITPAVLTQEQPLGPVVAQPLLPVDLGREAVSGAIAAPKFPARDSE